MNILITYRRIFMAALMTISVMGLCGQEVVFFDEGTNNDFYDQGIVNVNDLGESTFEHTYPPGGSPTQWNDKVPCSTTAFMGTTSLRFNYKSSDNGSWLVRIHRKGWLSADISSLDSIRFYIYSETNLPKTALPLIGIMTDNGTSEWVKLADFEDDVPASTWKEISFPLAQFKGTFDLTTATAVIFGQSESNNSSRVVLIDEIVVFNGGEVPPVTEFSAKGYDSHADLSWEHPISNLNYKVYASFDGGQTFELRTETTNNSYLDFVPQKGKNKTVTYRLVASVQGKDSETIEKDVAIRDFTDDELMEMVQEYCFRYFWEGAHQASGLALERSDGGNNTAASGATGFGLMAMMVAHEREFRPREDVKNRILLILNSLTEVERHHGAWSHWYNADTKKTVAFTPKDNGGDLVETSFVAQALVALKHYFSGSDSKSTQIREKANQLWQEIEWEWYRQNQQNVLYWHWSPNYGFEMNMKINGWNECLGTYIMAAASPTYGVPKKVYTEGYAGNGNMVNRRTFYGYPISLSQNWGGPLFWIHYAHHGINPHGLKDEYANYWTEHKNTALIHYQYAIENPLGFKNYSEHCWGLTASDDPDGYTAHKPRDNDNGTISPTAALASMPYTPDESMKALKYFYRERGSELFGQYGPFDAFNDSRNWVKKAYIGIDQGPIIIMIENHRTGLLWKNVMKDPDVQAGLDKLGFQYEVISRVEKKVFDNDYKIYPNPCNGMLYINHSGLGQSKTHRVDIYASNGSVVKKVDVTADSNTIRVDCSQLEPGIYMVQLKANNKIVTKKITIMP